MAVKILIGETSQIQYVDHSKSYIAETVTFTPYVSTDRGYEVSTLSDGSRTADELGISIDITNATGEMSDFKYTDTSRSLLQSWRAMRLLERASVITKGVLRSAWYSVKAEDFPARENYLIDMAKHFVDRKTFDVIRSDVMNAVPDDVELSLMLTTLDDLSFRLGDLDKIQQIIAKGPYPESKIILKEYLEKEAERRFSPRPAPAPEEYFP